MFTVVRYDSERAIVKLGESETLTGARDIMKEDFKKWFEEKYGYEMKQQGLTFEEMFEENEESDEYDVDIMTAYLNECNHVDFDWNIIEIEIPSETKRAIFDEYRLEAAKEDVNRVAENLEKESYSDEDLCYLAEAYLNNFDCNLTTNDQIEEMLSRFDENGRKHD